MSSGLPKESSLVSLWNSQPAPPDLAHWWQTARLAVAAGQYSPAELMQDLLLDQQYRWKTTAPWSVEDYLEKLSALPSGMNWRLNLAVGEIEARRNTETPLSDQELAARFPDLIGQISGDRGTQPPEIRAAVPDHPVSSLTTVSYELKSWIGEYGRYRLDETLGEGAFGVVYLGWDEELERQVAIKIPKTEKRPAAAGFELYLREAQAAAGLSHPNIVTVFDVGRTDDGLIYIISQYIRGETLQDQLQRSRPDYRSTAELLATVALALHYAHTTRRLIHRDVKPANILIEESSGKPFVADFGLAIREDQSIRETLKSGSPAYMSPEQARGESHRLDARSDVFSLGAICYEMLTGLRPFRGACRTEVLSQVIAAAPAAPRSVDASVPAELERICLKALSGRASDRYSTAAEFAADLQAWLQPATVQATPRRRGKFETRGLRSFDEQDQDFFLDLLPGRRDRDDLPESIVFWKQRIEACSGEQTFSVGLIYGPSGCGKSSLVKAGLLPRLGKNVIPVYLESATSGTEEGLARMLRTRLPELSPSAALPQLLSEIRRGSGPKIVVFLDQFEQWLHGNKGDHDAELVVALKQCDGARLQAVLMVREDYFPEVSRLMDRHLDVPIVMRQNCATLELFDVSHAARVLTQFGISLGCLPESQEHMSPAHLQFIEMAVAELAEDGRVISVRLALFAEMMRQRTWEPCTLRQMGGTAGVGVAYLETTFGKNCDIRYRQHLPAIRAVLQRLLPPIGTDIKATACSEDCLREYAGYQQREREFSQTLQMLDLELRLITPTVQLPTNGHQEPADLLEHAAARSYQLTHDYLVAALQIWLAMHRRDTARGRAELKLEEHASMWCSRPANRMLPSIWCWLQILRYVPKSRRTDPQRKMLVAARKLHLRRSLVASIIACVMLLCFAVIHDRIRALELQMEVDGLANSFGDLRRELAPDQLKRTSALPVAALQLLQQSSAGTEPNGGRPLGRLLARLQVRADVSDADRSLILTTISECTAAELPLLAERLEPAAASLASDVVKLVLDSFAAETSRLNAVCVLSAWSVKIPAAEYLWNDANTIDFVAGQFSRVAFANPADLLHYEATLHSEAAKWIPRLTSEILSRKESAEPAPAIWIVLESNRDIACQHLEKELQEMLRRLREVETTNKRRFMDRVASLLDRDVEPSLGSVIRRVQDLANSLQPLLVRSIAAAAAGLLRLSSGDQVWPLLADSANPTLRNLILQRLPHFGCDADMLLRCASSTGEAGIRCGVIQAIGELADAKKLSEATRAGAISQLLHLYRSDRDPAVHSACAWTLGRLNAGDRLLERDGFPRINSAGSDHDWYLTGSIVKPLLTDHPAAALEKLKEFAALTETELAVSTKRLERARCLCLADQTEKALSDFTWLRDNCPNSAVFTDPETLGMFCVALARMGRKAESERLFTELQKTSLVQSFDESISLQMLAARGEGVAVIDRLGAAEGRYANEPNRMFDFVRAASMSSLIFQQRGESTISTALRGRALDLLALCCRAGSVIPEDLSNDVQLYPLHVEVRFHELLMSFLPIEARRHSRMELAIIDMRDSRLEPPSLSVQPWNPGSGRFAIGMCEVTEAQHAASVADNSHTGDYKKMSSIKPAAISWHEAARFCNWLSEQEGIPEDQWCYVISSSVNGTMELKTEAAMLTGYRMPFFDEWSVACKGSASTVQPCGDLPELLRDYCWYDVNSVGKEGPFDVAQLRPGQMGLFDMQGNSAEWVSDWEAQPAGTDATDVTMSRKLLCGGHFWDSPDGVTGVKPLRTSPDSQPYTGFRVARTFRPTP